MELIIIKTIKAATIILNQGISLGIKSKILKINNTAAIIKIIPGKTLFFIDSHFFHIFIDITIITYMIKEQK